MIASELAGTPALARLAARRDRVLIPAWVYVLTALVAATVFGFKNLFTSVATRQLFAITAGRTTAFTFLYGPVQGSSIGALTAWRYGVIAAVGAALESIFVVTRHTRADEEAGRLELVGSASVGRSAPLTASLLVALAASTVLVPLMGAALALLGLPVAGSFALAAAVAATGLCFGAVAAVTAQVSGTARGARGLAIAALGAFFLIRGAGDAASGVSWLGWASPLGWVSKVRPFAGERWWVLALPLACAVVGCAAAYWLAAHRDHGTGLLRPRAGSAQASPLLSGPLGLAWRLHRGALAGWAIAIAVSFAIIGVVGHTIRSLVSEASPLRQELGRLGGQAALTDAFLAAIMGLAGLMVAGYAISAVLRLRAEESAERAEPLLARATSRLSWAASHLVFALGGMVVLLALAGLAAGLAYGVTVGDPGLWGGRLAGAALAQLPAALAVAAVPVALFGLAPDAAAGGAWSAYAVSVLLALFGPVLSVSHWVIDLSPYVHAPKVPGSHVAAEPLIWLAAIAAALTAAGLAGLRRRDIG